MLLSSCPMQNQVTTRSTAAAAIRYDASSGQYIFNLSTKGLTAVVGPQHPE
jgi:hypothetical protein